MKYLLSPEQSATLIAKGISADKASMFAGQKVRDGKGNPLSKKEKNREYNHGITLKKGIIICGLEHIEYTPIFTLADICALLPKGVIHDGLSCKLRITTWYDESYFAGYENQVGKYIMSNPYDAPFSAEELIDVLYELLLWAIDYNHVKLD